MSDRVCLIHVYIIYTFSLITSPLRFMDVLHKTSVKKKTLNPKWNETFDIMVYDKECQFVDFTLYDYDQMSAGDFLGKTTLSMACLPVQTEEEFNLDLMDVKKGSLQVSCQYTPLKKTTEEKATEEAKMGDKEDILFELSPELLTSDILEAELDPDTLVNSANVSRNSTPKAASMSSCGKPSFKSLSSDGSDRLSSSGVIGSPEPLNTTGVLTVSCIRGRHFYNMHGSFLKKGKQTIRPYVSMIIGNVKKDTIVQKDHHDPHYGEVCNAIALQNHA